MNPTLKQIYFLCIRKIIYFIALSGPVVVFLLPFVLNHGHALDYDWDYFSQLYEGARVSILEYRQFPWMNPWVAGGVPLYANPQFGLFSVQTPLVLAFGTLLGLKLSVLVLFVSGFWGMRNLLLRLGSDRLISVLLSYIWVFSGFTAWHLRIGHFTFLVYFLAPWFLLCLMNIRKKWGWLWLGLVTAVIMNHSMHYITVQMLLIALPLSIYQIISHRRKYGLSYWRLIKPYLFALAVTVPLVLHKLYFTMQYLHDFPRIPPLEIATPFNLIIAGLTFRGAKGIDPSASFGMNLFWAEYSVYFGLLTLGLFAYLFIHRLQMKEGFDMKHKLLLIGILLLFLLSLGSFSQFSPYATLKELPVFSQMQGPARWLGWLVFGVIVILTKLRRSKLIIAILAISVVDVFLSNFYVINHQTPSYQSPIKNNRIIEQRAFYKNSPDFSPNSLRSLHATQSNIGDIYGYEPLVGFAGIYNEGYRGASKRCDTSNTSCQFVLTNNAVVEYWSPNLIKLRRISSGDIELNVNPGSYWVVNGQRVFNEMNVVELRKNFVIKSSSEEIIIIASPKPTPF